MDVPLAEVSSSEDHPVPGQTGVAGQETQPGLHQPLLHLGLVGEELRVAGTGEVLDVVRLLPALTGRPRPRLTN